MTEFVLSTKKEYETFEKQLNQYMKQKSQGSSRPSFFGDAYESLEGRDDRNRIMTSLFDLKINYFFVMLDIQKVGGTWNRSLANNQNLGKGLSILDVPELFNPKVDMLYAINSSIVRIRSFLDKYMGFIVLHLIPDEYDAFCRAKSKRRKFSKIARKLTDVPRSIQHSLLHTRQQDPFFARLVDAYESDSFFPNYYLLIFEDMSQLIDDVRTHEVHNTGILRKSTLMLNDIQQSKDLNIIGFANFANALMGGIEGVFNQKELTDFTKSIKYEQSLQLITMQKN